MLFPSKTREAPTAAGPQEPPMIPGLAFMERLPAVPTANDAFGAALLGDLRHRPSDRIGALSETLVFEQAHWAVPQDGFRLRDFLGISLDGLGANIQPRGIVGTVEVRTDGHLLIINHW